VHLLHDLRAAFEGGRLFLVYQPQIDLVSGRALGVEALLRWRDESGEFVPLERFIPVAEQSGLIVGIGAWVLRTALAAQRELLAQGFRLRMAVNVSPVQFRHPAFVTTVAAAVAELAIDPALLELEITESVALHGGAQIGERLHDLKRLGVTIAIDDFGTGFSSLSYLDRLPADCLKIDRSFVHALDERLSGAQIADLVVQLGKRLGMRVLAEGIEVAAQWQTLVDMGCGEGQGWLYAPALPVDELIPWLRGRER
jgi:EAL domain-containing protein (putative c-di-GMP-specific phosphodiesterase class I)